MIKRISKTEAIKEYQRKEGNSRLLNAPEHIESIVTMNDNLKEVRKDFQVKDRNSQIIAKKVVLNS